MGPGFRFTQEVIDVLTEARQLALHMKSTSIGVTHLLQGLARSNIPHAQACMIANGLDPAVLADLVPRVPERADSLRPLPYGEELMEVFEAMTQVGASRNEHTLGTGHIVAGLLKSGNTSTQSLGSALRDIDPIRFLGPNSGDLSGEKLPPPNLVGDLQWPPIPRPLGERTRPDTNR